MIVVQPETESEVSWCVVRNEVSSRATGSNGRGDINTAAKLIISTTVGRRDRDRRKCMQELAVAQGGVRIQ